MFNHPLNTGEFFPKPKKKLKLKKPSVMKPDKMFDGLISPKICGSSIGPDILNSPRSLVDPSRLGLV